MSKLFQKSSNAKERGKNISHLLIPISVITVLLSVSLLLVGCSNGDSSEGESEVGIEQANTVQDKSDIITELKSKDIYYGFDTAKANIMAGILDSTNDEETTVTRLQGGLQYVDEHNEYYPALDPGIDYFNSVDFNVEKRVIDKYPDNNYGLMHIVGSVENIEFDTQNTETNRYLNTNGITLMEMIGFCDSSNMYEDIVVYFLGDVSFAYQGSSVVVLGTPIGKLVDNATGDDALLVLGSFIATADADYTGKIHYGQTESEASNAMWMGGWYFNYMSEEKMKSEAIRLKKENRGFDENAADKDIPIELIEEGEWETSKDSQEYILISLNNIDKEIENLKISVKSYEDAYRTDSEEYKIRVDRLNRFTKHQKDCKYVVHFYTDTQFDMIAYGKVENGTVSLQFEDNSTGSLSLSFDKAELPVHTLAKEWYSDNTQSKDGIYLHFSSEKDLSDISTPNENSYSEYSDEQSSFTEESWSEENESMDTSEWMLPYSDSEYVDINELSDMFVASDYRLAINEIYARHGRIFKSEDLDEYFRNCSWYVPTYTAEQWEEMGGDNYFFNKYEKANISSLKEVQEKLGN